ncbi:hypothetical protein Mgra_00009338 [Meloidogyne graminicola]|uniref:Uncharacterized protein n=1 Tax=Meloidogyne graminicola TaxID=189291 RepID=A0A2R4SDF3_9BILA|nr:hypothetical protein [Meloidogyne graminicola]KAF7627359.1 hypothetical protein Mgra_00009338 [Meloidogyne graminicola]
MSSSINILFLICLLTINFQFINSNCIPKGITVCDKKENTCCHGLVCTNMVAGPRNENRCKDSCLDLGKNCLKDGCCYGLSCQSGKCASCGLQGEACTLDDNKCCSKSCIPDANGKLYCND